MSDYDIYDKYVGLMNSKEGYMNDKIVIIKDVGKVIKVFNSSKCRSLLGSEERSFNWNCKCRKDVLDFYKDIFDKGLIEFVYIEKDIYVLLRGVYR